MEVLGLLPIDVVRDDVYGYIPTRAQAENGRHPVEVVYHNVKYRKTYKIRQTDRIYRYYQRDKQTRLCRPFIMNLEIEMRDSHLTVPMTFLEVKQVIEEHIHENALDNYQRERRFYRIVYCLFSKIHACEWVRYMNRQVKQRGHIGNFRLKQFRETTVNNWWYGSTKVWRYARRQDWQFLPKSDWHRVFHFPPSILCVPIAMPYEPMYEIEEPHTDGEDSDG